jgi:crotonobetainyl-CoA:carnitine CoA-transferase CaiB-like acyl-CoA transferase
VLNPQQFRSAAVTGADSDDVPPLAGTRVLEVGSGVAAAYCTHLLAGFGADVLRLEPDPVDLGGPEYGLTADEEVYLLAGKRRVAAGGDAVAAAAAVADVVVEGTPPGWLRAAGADPADLLAARPELLVTSITPFGQDGPYAGRRATNIVAFGSGGIMSLTGELERPPLQTGGKQALYLGGLHGFAATTTALVGVAATGTGDWIDISLQECAASMLELYAAMWEYDSEVAVRMGNSVRAQWGVYPVVDGYAGVCCLERQMPALFDLLDVPDLDDERFRDPVRRIEHNDELLAHILVFMSGHTKDELVALSPVHRIPFGAVLTPRELLDDAGLRERGFFGTVGAATVPGRPFPDLGWRDLDAVAAPHSDVEAAIADWAGGE